ncbi:MAG: ribonuclease P protein component [Pararhodobacter sp.]
MGAGDTAQPARPAETARPDTGQAAVRPVLHGACRPAVSVIRNRADFLKAARARRQAVPGFLLQARRRRQEEPFSDIRVGFTCSRKVGNAVTRNRAKRRLRALAHAVLADEGRKGWDYVLVGRPQVTVARAWPDLIGDLRRALESVHAEREARP